MMHLVADGIDARMWMLLVFAALSVVGSIFGKKKQDEEKSRQQSARQAGKPSARPRVPPPVPRTSRPVPPTRPPGPTVPEVLVRRTPPEQPVREKPARPIPRPIEARPSTLPGHRTPLEAVRELLLGAQVEPALIATEPEEPPPLSTIGGEAPHETKRPPPDRGVQDRRVRRLLGNKSGLRTALILSEILAPPLALRDNHPF